MKTGEEEETTPSSATDTMPGKRCPDFDEDCASVPDHAKCAAGAVIVLCGSLITVPPIDGFCPYACGMIRFGGPVGK